MSEEQQAGQHPKAQKAVKRQDKALTLEESYSVKQAEQDISFGQPHKEQLIAAIHKEKILAAINNPKAKADIELLQEALKAYDSWINKMEALKVTGEQRVHAMTALLNEYKDYLEVELIAGKGSDFLKRQKGQLKLDNSVLEEFLIHLVHPAILNNLPGFALDTGPQTAFMSLAFRPSSINHLDQKPEVIIKVKDQDFTIGKAIHYKFSSDNSFRTDKTINGQFHLAVLSAECKVNYDKTMFQECAGTASRLKQGCPIAKYYALVEYLDMQPEDVRLTDIDNVFLLRKAKRLPFERRGSYDEVKNQHKNYPIAADVVWKFVQEIQSFIDTTWYDPEEALKRGSFL